MKYKNILTLLCILLAIPVAAKDIMYPASSIADSLKQNAYAVTRYESTTFIQSSKTEAVCNITKVITILDKRGADYANFDFNGSKFRELIKFSGIVRNAAGKEIRKIKKNELTTSNFKNDLLTLATDANNSSFEYQSPVYPFTVEYTYSVKHKGGLLSYNHFTPYEGYHTSVEKSEYLLEVSNDTQLRYHANFANNLQEKEVNGKKVYTISVQNMKAIDYEPSMPPIDEVMPVAFFAPSDFCYDSFCGNMSNWNTYGAWVWQLTKDRGSLPAELTDKLLQLTADAQTDREKVKRVYEFMQNNTRYVSIQLGIGGFRPMEATDTYQKRFGDCKALSNLTYAMLKAIGLPATYCVIRSGGKKTIFPDFPNFSQFNHAILMVPLPADTIWLECTSQTAPFGYIHDGIAGHDALAITPAGGVVYRLPEYTDSQNLEESFMEVTVNEDGSAKGSFTFTDHLHGFSGSDYLYRTKDQKRITTALNSRLNLPQVQLSDIQTRMVCSELPYATANATFQTNDFANKTESRLFLPACPFKKSEYTTFSASKREHDIYKAYGYSEKDSIIFIIPKGFNIESLPKNTELNTKFGSFRTHVTANEGKIVYHQYIEMKSGFFRKENYAALKEFYAKINAALKRKIVIKKS